MSGRYKYLKVIAKPNGKKFRYYSRPGFPRVRLREEVGTEAFDAEFQCAAQTAYSMRNTDEQLNEISPVWAAVAATVIRRTKGRAASKGLPMDICEQWFKRRLLDQNFKCSISMIPFSFAHTRVGSRNPYLPSIDRKNCSEGYVQGNCRLVLSGVNNALADYGDAFFIEMCRSVARTQRARK